MQNGDLLLLYLFGCYSFVLLLLFDMKSNFLFSLLDVYVFAIGILDSANQPVLFDVSEFSLLLSKIPGCRNHNYITRLHQFK